MAKRVENQPKMNGNGEMTLSFYEQQFGFTGRQALGGRHLLLFWRFTVNQFCPNTMEYKNFTPIKIIWFKR